MNQSRVEHDDVGDASGPMLTPDLVGQGEYRLHTGGLLVCTAQCDVCADRSSHPNRCREPHLIEAVVQGGSEFADLQNLSYQNGSQRQSEVAVGDGPVEWSVDGALGIGMDPLVVVRGIREQVDLLLGYLDPLSGAQRLTDQSEQIGRSVEMGGHRQPFALR